MTNYDNWKNGVDIDDRTEDPELWDSQSTMIDEIYKPGPLDPLFERAKETVELEDLERARKDIENDRLKEDLVRQLSIATTCLATIDGGGALGEYDTQRLHAAYQALTTITEKLGLKEELLKFQFGR